MMGTVTLTSWYPSLIGAAIAVGALWLLLRLLTRVIARIAEGMEPEGVFDEGARWARSLTRFVRRAFWLVAVLAAAAVMLTGLGVTGLPRFSTEGIATWVFGPGLRLVVIVASAYLLARAVHFLVESLQVFLVSRNASQAEGALEQRKRVETIGQLLRVLATVLIWGVAILMSLSLFGVDIRPILTGAGIAGLAVGFGAQNLVRDVISGFFLILENQVRIGDVVAINGKSGLVEAIRLRTIVLRSLDGTVHVIPNGVITELSNMTKDFSYAVLDIGVAYKEDIDRVTGVLRDVARQLQVDPAHGPSILEPLEVLGVDAFADSAVVIKIRLKTVPIQQWATAREFRRRIKMAFDAHGIEIPFPHVSVYAGEASRPLPVRITPATRDRA
jgi:small conductance mechanosensitive channel